VSCLLASYHGSPRPSQHLGPCVALLPPSVAGPPQIFPGQVLSEAVNRPACSGYTYTRRKFVGRARRVMMLVGSRARQCQRCVRRDHGGQGGQISRASSSERAASRGLRSSRRAPSCGAGRSRLSGTRIYCSAGDLHDRWVPRGQSGRLCAGNPTETMINQAEPPRICRSNAPTAYHATIATMTFVTKTEKTSRNRQPHLSSPGVRF
jgi:hypothetical protein